MATKKILADLHVDGNVGIGTTTLQNSSGYKTLSINGSTGGQIAFQTSGAGRHYIFGSATDFNIYNSTAGNLILHTNAAERMRIDANGNVGIGTDNPNRTFQVAGSFAITDSSDTSSILIIPSTSVNNIYSRQSQGVNSSTPLAVTMGTSEVFRIETDGNVGIGTDTPGAKLTVAGDVLIDSGEYLSWGAAGATSIEGSTASNKLQFRTSSTDRMIINDTGVGIGTTSPGEKLTVHSTATAISSFYTTNSAGGFTSYQNSTGGVKGFVGYGPTLFTGLDINNFGLRSQSGMPFATGGGNVRMYINSSGNVGIGTTSPGYKLDVESSTTPLHLNRTGGATALIGLDIAGVNRGLIGATTTAAFVSYSSAAASLMTVLNTGNVGIGTTTPSAKLVLRDTIALEQRIIHTSNGTTVLRRDGAISYLLSESGITANRVLAFGSQVSAGSAITERMRIDTSGNVGIGTTSPGHKLEVFETGNSLSIGDNTNTQTYMSFAGTRTMMGYSGVNALIQGGSGKGIQFNVNNDSFNSGEAMRITSAGNVGIGTTSPAVKLDVNGGGRFNTTTGSTPFYITRNGANDQALKVHVDDANVVFESIQDETADDYGGFIFNMDAGTTEPYFDVRKNNGTIIRVDGSGNVGIGTTSPALQSAGTGLHINATTSSELKFTNNTTGSSAADGTALVATSNNFTINNRETGSISLGTSNSVRMHIEAGGNVGIGITDPDSRLDINAGVSNIVTGPAVRISKGASPIGLIRYDTVVIEANDVATIRIGESDGTVSSIMSGDDNLRINSTDPIKFYTAGTTTGEAHAGQGGTFAMIIDNSQNVGIGTTSPAGALSVENTGTAGVPVLDIINTSVSQFNHSGEVMTPNMTTGQNNIFVIGRAGSTKNSGYIGYKYLGTAGSNANILTLGHWGSDNLMNIDGLGNVGIGTITPQAKLEVASGDLIINNSGGKIDFRNGSGSSRYFLELANSNADLQINDRTGAGSVSMTIQSGGNVGIGTTSPATTLEVKTGTSAGTVRLSSDGNGAIFSANGDLQFYTNNTVYATKFYSANKASTLATILDSGKVLVGVTSNQTQSKLTSRQNGSAIEFGHLNQSSGYYGTLGSMYSSGRPFLAFSCDNDSTSAGNNFATRGFKGNVIFSETNGNLKFAQATNANSTSQALTDRMAIKNDGAVQFNAYNSTNKTGTPTYLLGTDASGNVVKTNTVPGSGAGPYLPLAGGTMTGDILLSEHSVKFDQSGTRSWDISAGSGNLNITSGDSGGNVFLSPGLVVEDATTVGGNLTVTGNQYFNGSEIQGDSKTMLRYSDAWLRINEDNDFSSGIYCGTGILRTDGHFQVGNVGDKFEINSAGDIRIRNRALINQQENTDVDTGTETVANVLISSYTAAFFDFVIKNGTNVRSGTVYACHDGTNVEFTETSTNDLGDTSDVTLSVDISGGNMRLRATTTSDDWSVKSLIRAI